MTFRNKSLLFKPLAAVLTAASAVALFAAPAQTAIARNPICPANMSCIPLTRNFSPVPPPMSLVPIDFTVAATWTRHEISAALVNLGFAYMWMATVPE